MSLYLTPALPLPIPLNPAPRLPLPKPLNLAPALPMPLNLAPTLLLPLTLNLASTRPLPSAHAPKFFSSTAPAHYVDPRTEFFMTQARIHE